MSSQVVSFPLNTSHSFFFRCVMLALSSEQRWCRPGVTIGRTTVAADENGFGAFAPENAEVKRGCFIGVYRASHWRRGGGKRYTGANKYVMQVGQWRAYPGGVDKIRAVDVFQYPMCAVQDPPPAVAAHCRTSCNTQHHTASIAALAPTPSRRRRFAPTIMP